MSVETLSLGHAPDSRLRRRQPLRREAHPFSAGLSRDQLIESISDILMGTMGVLDESRISSSNLKSSSLFHAKKVPGISLFSYLQRFAKFSSCSDSCFIILLIFIDRITEFNPNFELDSLNVHR